MRHSVIICLILAGCAHDNYTVIPNSNGSQQAMKQDLWDCKMQSFHTYNEQHPVTIDPTMMIAGGAIGGAVGGAIFGAGSASTAQNNPSAMKPRDVHFLIENCMEERGYEGTSN